MVCQNIASATRKLLTVASLSVLVACGGGGEATDEAAGASAQTAEFNRGVELAGRAVKGVISNGIVSVYPVVDEGGRLVAGSQRLSAPVRTDEDGYYVLPLSAAFSGDRFVVEVTADDRTRMKCELVQGCSEAESVAFGEVYSVGGDFSLSAVTQLSVGQSEIAVHLTPLTHMARLKAESNAQGLTLDGVAAAITEVAGMFELSEASVTARPVDITNQEELSGVDTAELHAAMIGVAIQDLANSAQFDDIAAVIKNIEDRLSQHDALVLVDQGLSTEVALDDLLYRASVELGALAQDTEVSDTVVRDVVAIVDGAQQDVMNEASLVASVSIVGQPSAVVVDEFDAFTLSVGAVAGGNIAFQWYKDDAPIMGATTSTFVREARLVDSGFYSVKVSNEVGSVNSESVYVRVVEQVADDSTGGSDESANENEGGQGGGSLEGDQIGTVLLSWDIPTEREDGTSLELYEISGYTIAYGVSETDLALEVSVVGNVTSYSLEDLQLGTYYFAIATVDSDGVRGRFSDVIAVTVD